MVIEFGHKFQGLSLVYLITMHHHNPSFWLLEMQGTHGHGEKWNHDG